MKRELAAESLTIHWKDLRGLFVLFYVTIAHFQDLCLSYWWRLIWIQSLANSRRDRCCTIYDGNMSNCNRRMNLTKVRYINAYDATAINNTFHGRWKYDIPFGTYIESNVISWQQTDRDLLRAIMCSWVVFNKGVDAPRFGIWGKKLLRKLPENVVVNWAKSLQLNLGLQSPVIFSYQCIDAISF